MKAIEILTGNGRPVDRLESALQPGNMTIEIATNFLAWLYGRIGPSAAKKHGDEIKIYMIEFARGASEHKLLFHTVRMVALLAIEAKGFGGKGRRERKAQCRELLRICRKHEKETTKC